MLLGPAPAASSGPAVGILISTPYWVMAFCEGLRSLHGPSHPLRSDTGEALEDLNVTSLAELQVLL